MLKSISRYLQCEKIVCLLVMHGPKHTDDRRKPAKQGYQHGGSLAWWVAVRAGTANLMYIFIKMLYRGIPFLDAQEDF